MSKRELLTYCYNCSREYIEAIDPDLYCQITDAVARLPKRQNQRQINNDLFWLLTTQGWTYDTLSGVSDLPPRELLIETSSKVTIGNGNDRSLCSTTTTLNAHWHSDFAKVFDDKLVQVEAQFGKVESMFKDFCGFRIARNEKRLALGIEIVICEPGQYFSHRKGVISGMAYFDIAKNTLPAIGLACPIWLIGIT